MWLFIFKLIKMRKVKIHLLGHTSHTAAAGTALDLRPELRTSQGSSQSKAAGGSVTKLLPTLKQCIPSEFIPGSFSALLLSFLNPFPELLNYYVIYAAHFDTLIDNPKAGDYIKKLYAFQAICRLGRGKNTFRWLYISIPA